MVVRVATPSVMENYDPYDWSVVDSWTHEEDEYRPKSKPKVRKKKKEKKKPAKPVEQNEALTFGTDLLESE